LRSGNNDPRGAASDASGQRVWVIDNDDYVYVYDAAGNPLGYWKANGLSTPEGIASNGTDLWIVDRGKDRVYRFAGGANRTSGSASATSSFALNSGNRDAKGIETDGTHLWIINDASTNKVFKYTLSGMLVGSWTISGNNTTPTGITLDPSNPSDIWIVDSGRDQVFQYTGAAGRTGGSQSPSAVFNLASGNSNPQGIADPPHTSGTDAADWNGLSTTAEDLMLAAVDQIFSKESQPESASNQDWEFLLTSFRGLNVAVQRFIPRKPTIPPNPVRVSPVFALNYGAGAESLSALRGLQNTAARLISTEPIRLSPIFFALLGNSPDEKVT
jgi:hypothetical protein